MRRRSLKLSVPLLAAGIIAGTLPALASGGGQATLASPFMIAPFILLLLAIALMPFIARRWWERYYPFVSAGLGALTVFYYLAVLRNPERMAASGLDYFSFVVLIGSLFVVAGGIHIRIGGRSTPLSNTVLLAVGAVASNVLGTTGASMILIRPFLRANKNRLRGFHVVFFIFLVSNIGGALSPIGDPPLFLGYLKGVPFFWVLENVWHIWLIAVVALGLSFFVLDSLSFRRFQRGQPAEGIQEDAEFGGGLNLLLAGVILFSLFIEHPRLLREALMLAAAAASYFTTDPEIHEKNGFSFIPVKEVAILFLGIFATMMPALDWLELHATRIGITTPGQFYWGTGILSSVLDNAPTYLNFLSASIGLLIDRGLVDQVQILVSKHGADLPAIPAVHAEEIRRTFAALMRYHADLVATGTVSPEQIKIAYLLANQGLYLKAISIGAVFFGAVTYIGNGPNFMVKSIADQSGAACPNFPSYLLRYSLPILIPLFAIIWFIFFRS